MKLKILLIFLIIPSFLYSQWHLEKAKDAWGDNIGKSFVVSEKNQGSIISWKNRPRVNYASGSYNYSVKITSDKIIIWSTDMPSWNRKEKADSNYVKIKFDNEPEIKTYASMVQGSQVNISSKLSLIKSKMRKHNIMKLYYLVNTKKIEVVINLKGFTKAVNMLN